MGDDNHTTDERSCSHDALRACLVDPIHQRALPSRSRSRLRLFLCKLALGRYDEQNDMAGVQQTTSRRSGIALACCTGNPCSCSQHASLHALPHTTLPLLQLQPSHCHLPAATNQIPISKGTTACAHCYLHYFRPHASSPTGRTRIALRQHHETTHQL